MEFANKEYLFLLLLMIPYLIWYLMYRKKSEPTMRMSDTRAYRYAPRSWRVMLMPLQLLLRLAVFVLLILVLARPQTQNSWKNETMEGIKLPGTGSMTALYVMLAGLALAIGAILVFRRKAQKE